MLRCTRPLGGLTAFRVPRLAIVPRVRVWGAPQAPFHSIAAAAQRLGRIDVATRVVRRRRWGFPDPDPSGATVLHAVIGGNAVVFGMWHLDAVSKDFMLRHFTTSYEAVHSGRWHTLLTAAFSHFSLMHLLANMSVLYVMSSLVLPRLGSRRFLALYLTGAAASSAAQVSWDWWSTKRRIAALAQVGMWTPSLIQSVPRSVPGSG